MTPRVVIGVPTLNGPERLQRCLTAIADCTDFTRGDTRVLVADDGSTEENLKFNKDVIHNASARIPNLAMLFGQGRTGVPATWNRLMRHAESDVGVLINDDIEVASHWLDVLVYSVTQNKRAGMVSLNCYVGVTKDQVPRGPRVDYHEAHLLDGGGRLLCSGGAIFAIRRDAFDTAGGFDERYF